jgi:hypothetical protein
MKRIFLWLAVALCAAAAVPPKPKLVVTIVVDQFRYDYLTRFGADYKAGLARLLSRGAVFTNAYYQHVPAITAVGHSTVLTGATPSVSGIVANEWFDRDENVAVTSVGDSKTTLLGGTGNGASPNRLMVSTLGDEMKMAWGAKAHVVGVSLKDRAAILPSGHMADAAYWFDPKTGNFVSSSFYFTDVPQWVKEFNAPRPADGYRGQTWMTHKMPDDLVKTYTAIEYTPWGNDLVEAFAERALTAEKLGLHAATDLLTVSFSANDYVGHSYGPDSEEVRQTAIEVDRQIGKLLDAVDRQVGVGNYAVVFTADHGVSPKPEVNQARRMPGGRIDPAAIKSAVQTALMTKFGAGEWVAGQWDLGVYLNQRLVAQGRLDLAAVEKEAARAVMALPHVSRVYTLEEMRNQRGSNDAIGQKVANGFHLRRGPDVELIPDPYWFVGTGTGASHSLPYSYDTHVPVIFMGPAFKKGQYHFPVAVNDIAPTLATVLAVETPSGSVGRVLTEMLVE